MNLSIRQTDEDRHYTFTFKIKVTTMYINSDELIRGCSYKGYPLMRDKGPFVRSYLDKVIDVMSSSINDHSRTFAFRVDLKLPKDFELLSESRLIDRFISSFKSKVDHARRRASREDKYAHRSSVRYLWAREEAQRGRPHYHFVFFLNHDAFNVIGKYEQGRANTFNRLIEAWAVALGITADEVLGLVHLPKNATYLVTERDLDSQDALFERASYMTKVATKVRGSRHCFGGSRG